MEYKWEPSDWLKTKAWILTNSTSLEQGSPIHYDIQVFDYNDGINHSLKWF